MADEPQAPGGPEPRDLFQRVYQELRALASHQLARERPGHSLNPTALVHEAYLRLVVSAEKRAAGQTPQWASHRQFFVAAAEAMRHILVDRARYHRRQKRGGGQQRQDIELDKLAVPGQADVLALNDALDGLAAEQAEAAELVKLRYFAGLTLDEVAKTLELTRSTVDRRWAFAKAWLHERLSHADETPGKNS
jgi:RNA polymerase sigma factor (TIGR02999 family)